MQKLFYKDSSLIGLDIGSNDMKLMAIAPDKWTVLAHGAIDVDSVKMRKSLDNDGEYLKLRLKRLLLDKLHGNLPSTQVAVSIPTSRTYSRTFSIPATAKKNLKEAIELEISQYIPVPITLLYVDYEIIHETKDALDVLVSAAPKVVVDNIIDACAQAGLTVNLVEPSINSIARILQSTESGTLPTAIIDIGSVTTDVAILEKGIIRVTGSTATGGNAFTLNIAKKLNVSIENAHQLKILNGLNVGPRQKKITAALESNLKKISLEARRVMRYYNERVQGEKVEQVIIVGGGSNVPGIGEYFTNELTMPARVASPWQRLNFGKLEQPAKQLRPRYIGVAGVATITKEEVLE